MTYQRMGVRYQRVRSRGSRWGEPKIHLTTYRRETKEWVLVCDQDAWHGYPAVDDKEPVTCLKCLKASPNGVA